MCLQNLRNIALLQRASKLFLAGVYLLQQVRPQLRNRVVLRLCRQILPDSLQIPFQ